jgi:OmpA-OmpF porin, OOP family
MKLLQALGLLTTLASIAAFAQTSRQPSAEEIVRKLAQPPANTTPAAADTPDTSSTEGATSQPTTRSLSRGIRIENRVAAAATAAPPSLDLEVNFEFNSARLTPDARIVLDNLGQALNDPALRDSRIRIAGHTDAKGGDAYNLNLSRARAQSVADYLANQHRIDNKRLMVEGLGRTQLLDPANPESAVNRRVQVVNLGKAP